MRSGSGVGWAVVGALWLCASGASAQPAGPAASAGETAEMTAKARELYNDGMKAASKRHWGEAHAALLAAWGLKQQYQIAGNLGAAEVQLGRYREAAGHLSYYLRLAPAAKLKERANVQALLDEARKHVGALVVKVEPTGAEVLVDGAVVGKAPLDGEVFVEPGARSVEARLAGYNDAKQSVEAAAGRSREVALALVKRAEKDPGTGTATGMSTGAGTNTGAGTTTGTGAGTATGTGAGTNTGGGAGVTGQPTEASGGPRKAVIIGGIAASSVAVVAGAVFAGVSASNASDARVAQDALLARKDTTACSRPMPVTECGALRDSLAAKDTFGNAATWSFVAGAAVGVGTLVFALATPKTRERGEVKVAPVIAADSGGVILAGRW